MTAPSSLVNGNDASGVDGFLFFVLLSRVAVRAASKDFVLRIRELETSRPSQLYLAEQDHLLMGLEDVAQERLVEPDRTRHVGGVADQHLEDLEPRSPGRSKMAAEDLASHRTGVAWLEARDRLKVPAIFVPDWKSVEEILDRGKANTPQIRRAARTHALQKLERHLQDVRGAHGDNVKRAMVAPRWWARRSA